MGYDLHRHTNIYVLCVVPTTRQRLNLKRESGRVEKREWESGGEVEAGKRFDT